MIMKRKSEKQKWKKLINSEHKIGLLNWRFEEFMSCAAKQCHLQAQKILGNNNDLKFEMQMVHHI